MIVRACAAIATSLRVAPSVVCRRPSPPRPRSVSDATRCGRGRSACRPPERAARSGDGSGCPAHLRDPGFEVFDGSGTDQLAQVAASSRVRPSRSIGSPAYACAIDVVNRMALIPSNAAWWQLRISRSPPSSRTSIARRADSRTGPATTTATGPGPVRQARQPPECEKSASSSICQVRVRVPRVGARSRARESGCAAIASLIAR